MVVETNGMVSEECKMDEEAHDKDENSIQKSNDENEAETNNMEDQQANKRVKTEKSEKLTKVKKPIKRIEPVCEICLQKLNDEDLRLYIGHPNNAVDEYSVLLDPKLCLFNGDELDITEGDQRALNKVTSFT